MNVVPFVLSPCQLQLVQMKLYCLFLDDCALIRVHERPDIPRLICEDSIHQRNVIRGSVKDLFLLRLGYFL